MIKKTIEQVGIDVFYKELKNGLKVFLIPQKDKKKYLIRYLTNFGSIEDEFVIKGRKVNIPPGTAHFLEHKIFEYEGEDPFQYYSKSGALVNAYTSHTRTVYTVDGNNNFEENLNYLVNFVNKPNFNDLSVEKEKGIIIEEIKMYNKHPNDKFFLEANKGIYHVHPRKEDVGGTVKSVKSVNKELLYDCYNAFYQPSNMAIIITGFFDRETALKVIENNEILGERESIKIEKVIPKEPIDVKTKDKDVKISKLQVNKMHLSFKFKQDNLKGEELFKYNLTFNIMLNVLFGDSSDFKNEMIEEGLLTNLYFNIETFYNFSVLNMVVETDEPEIIKNKILILLRDKLISDSDIKRIKRSLYASSMKFFETSDFISSVATKDINAFDDIIYNRVEIFNSITKKDILDLWNKIDLENYSKLYATKKL